MPEIPAKEEENRSGSSRRLVWLAVAVCALCAAFLLQWKNSLSQASIARTDSGAIVRAFPADAAAAPGGRPAFRILRGGGENFSEALLCDEAGNALCELRAKPDAPEIFRCPEDFSPEKISRERFLRIVIPALRGEGGGAPVVLLLENPFRK